MSRSMVIARREITSYFATPIGYVVMALYLVVSGILFSLSVLAPGQAASMRSFFEISVFLLLFIAPAISMRLLSEELRQGTLETLMTCPVMDWEVILGKWLASVGFFTAMLVPTLLYVVVLEVYANPDYGPIFCGYLGLFLIGCLYLAAGLLASAFWSSQILAYLIALFFWLFYWAFTSILPQYVGGSTGDTLFWMNINTRFSNDFGKGVLDLSSVVYLVSGIIFFLIAAVKVLESRRWR